MRDLLGFRYALEPLRTKCQWELQQQTIQLASLNDELDAQHAQLVAIRDEVTSTSAAMLKARDLNAVICVQSQRTTQNYLTHLHQKMTAAKSKLTSLEQQRESVMADLQRLKRFEEGLDEHREDALQEYGKLLGKQAIVEADEAWLRQTHWRLAR